MNFSEFSYHFETIVNEIILGLFVQSPENFSKILLPKHIQNSLIVCQVLQKNQQ